MLRPIPAFWNKRQTTSVICSPPLPSHSFQCYLEKNQSLECSARTHRIWPSLLFPVLIPWCSPIFLFHSSSSWNTHSQLPHIDNLHLLSSLTGMFFLLRVPSLALSSSDLYLEVTSAESISFITSPNIAHFSLPPSIFLSLILSSLLPLLLSHPPSRSLFHPSLLPLPLSPSSLLQFMVFFPLLLSSSTILNVLLIYPYFLRIPLEYKFHKRHDS